MVTMDNPARVYVKAYRSGKDIVVAACDEELVGSLIEDRQRNLRLYIDPAFFKGELRDAESLAEILSSATTANLVGKNAVEAAIKARLVHADAVLRIGDVLVAFFTRF
ncbi:MAG: DUF424 family protein [Desulfurococcaceae archaeon]